LFFSHIFWLKMSFLIHAILDFYHASMPALPDYLEIFQIQTESPGLLYRSPNLLDTKENAYFG